MNVEHRTSNVEHRIMYSTIYNKDKAKRLPHSTFDVERSMFDVQIVASEITTKPSYHVEITLKLCLQVRSSELIEKIPPYPWPDISRVRGVHLQVVRGLALLNGTRIFTDDTDFFNFLYLFICERIRCQTLIRD